jgi:hypothetical protein
MSNRTYIRSSFSFTRVTANTGIKKETANGYKIRPMMPPNGKYKAVFKVCGNARTPFIDIIEIESKRLKYGMCKVSYLCDINLRCCVRTLCSEAFVHCAIHLRHLDYQSLSLDPYILIKEIGL